MAGRRIRSIKPEWLEDEKLLRLGSDARVLSIALIIMADCDGRGRIVERVAAAEVFGFEPDPLKTFHESLMRLSGIGFVRRYEVRGQGYYEITNWHKHQRVQHPSISSIPAPLQSSCVSHETLSNPHETLMTDLDLDLDLKGSDQEATTVAADRKPKQRKPEDGLAAHVQSTFTRTHFAKHGSNPPKSAKAAKSVAVWCRANAIPMGRTPEALADTVVANYFATQDRRVVEAMHPFAWLANGPQRYAGKSVTLLTARPVDDGDELQAEWERKRAAIAAEKQLKLGDA